MRTTCSAVHVTDSATSQTADTRLQKQCSTDQSRSRGLCLSRGPPKAVAGPPPVPVCVFAWTCVCSVIPSNIRLLLSISDRSACSNNAKHVFQFGMQVVLTLTLTNRKS